MNHTGTNLKLATWNANSISNKHFELSLFLEKHSIDIMIINETKLKTNDKFYMKGFQVARNDRLGDIGAGGVAILVKNGIPFKTVPPVDCTVENIGIQLTNKTFITAIYNKPTNKIRKNCISKLTSYNKSLVVGDFNARHDFWNCNSANTNGYTLKRFLDENEDCILHFPENPTLYPANNTTPSTIDLVISKNMDNITEPESLPELSSDHNPVVFTVIGPAMENREKPIYDYKNTDWGKFREILDSQICINNHITSPEALEYEVSKFTQAVLNARDKTTKKLTFKPTESLPPHIKELIKYKNRIRKRFQSHRNPLDNELTKQLTTEIKNNLRMFNNDQWDERLKNAKPNDNTLWKLTKMYKKKHNEIPTLTQNSTDYITDEQKSNLIANTLQEIHNSEAPDEDFHKNIKKIVSEYLNSNHNLENSRKFLTNPKEVKAIIQKLPLSKAPGPDNIDNKLIKNLSKKAIVQLHYIINSIITLQHWPTKWKHAITIPILKPGKDKALPNSYRPISLLSKINILTEKIILDRLNKLTRKHKMQDTFQFGFKKNHSADQQICRIVTDIIKNFNKKSNTVMLLLDIEKAFDTVWVEGLIYKMIKLKLPPFLIKLIYSYLTNRTYQVKIHNTLSQIKYPKTGVPQGSVLGPRLYNIYVHDIPVYPGSNIALFADDTALYSHNYYASAANYRIQYHLWELLKYYNKWKIKINKDKTQQIVFSRKYTNNKIYIPLEINNHPIETTNSVKYLGVELDSRLNFHNHINNKVKKAYNASRALYPLLCRKSKMSIKNKTTIYKSLIRPIITYAAPAWCHLKPTPLAPLQYLQNRTLRLITRKNKYTRIAELHELTEMETIREHVDRIASDFYERRCRTNELTKKITQTRINNINPESKHPLPYQYLPIFLEPHPNHLQQNE